MTRNNLLVFDLDGTLLDSLPSLAKSFNWALQKMGHPIHPITDYKYIIGDGAQEGAKRCLPKNYRKPEEVSACLAMFREAYGTFWEETRPFPDITALLKIASKENCLAVLSNKDDAFTKSCVEKFFPNSFDIISGYKPEDGLKPEPSALLKIAGNAGYNISKTYMIGDTATDVRTAINARARSIGVLWGYREEEELVEAGADYIVGSVKELIDLLAEL